MKALIITYYWPPAGGSGVQRWLKFVKYLPDFGITPIVYTVMDPQYPITDDSLISEVSENVQVIRERIWEPNVLLSMMKRGEKVQSAGFLEASPSFAGRVLQYVRANFFIPDARKFWIKPSVRRLLKVIKDQQVDLLISTGPPHSVHLIGQALKKRTGIKWLADFRDPWTNIDYFHNLPLSKHSRKKHQDLENAVLKNADSVMVVGNSMKEEFSDRNKNIHVITNGFDGDICQQHELDQRFSISHIGLMNADRNPVILWEVLNELIDESSEFAKDLQVKLIGKCDREVYLSIQRMKLGDYINFVSYMPHKEVLKFQRSSQLLLIAVNNVPSAKAIITGKVFEYLQCNRPIIGIGPVEGDLSRILDSSRAGKMIDFNDKAGLKKTIRKYYYDFKHGGIKEMSHDIEKYKRRNLTADLATLMKDSMN